MDMNVYMMRDKVEQAEGWRDIFLGMPFLRFPATWEVAVSPPFAGATARFRVRRGDAIVSVYADYHSRLGYVGQPYWEIYPSSDLENCDRFLIHETEELIAAIEASLCAQEKDQAE